MYCIPDSHPHRVTNTKCRIDAVISPDDGHIVARNMQRKEINILRKTVHQVGFIYKFPIRFASFYVSSVCLLGRVTVVDENSSVVCCLLTTSGIMLSEKKKRKCITWSKKWYLKRNISCDAHLLNELLETDVP
jgi:hypothetical protein